MRQVILSPDFGQESSIGVQADELLLPGYFLANLVFAEGVVTFALGDDGFTEDGHNTAGDDLPFEIVQLSNAFPVGLVSHAYSTFHLLVYLPPEGRVLELVDSYYRNAARTLKPITHSDLVKSIIVPLYASGETIHAHQLAVLFAILAAAALPDESVQPTPIARRYYLLSRAALSLQPIKNQPTVSSVQALLILMWFMRVSDGKSHEERWLLGGICVKLAQAVGLHRENVDWKLSEDEIQERRTIYWELYSYESWASLTTGRSPCLTFEDANCQLPRDLEPFVNFSGITETGCERFVHQTEPFHSWRHSYNATCLTPSLKHVFHVKTASYQDLLNLDKELRGTSTPNHLRSYFTQATRAQPAEPLNHEYAFSVKAMVLGTLVIESTGSYLARDAFAALELAEQLFETTFHQSRSPSILAALQKLLKRCRDAMAAFHSNLPLPNNPVPDCGGPSSEPDELAVLGGRQSVIMSKTSSSGKPQRTAPSTHPAENDNPGHNEAPLYMILAPDHDFAGTYLRSHNRMDYPH
ncbi:hypothetical protein HWV62_22137 [Athelia sp. TMB]|nr:hypothetical protein HWV62_22137 [Athelia sp. TMB]